MLIALRCTEHEADYAEPGGYLPPRSKNSMPSRKQREVSRGSIILILRYLGVRI